MDSDEERDEEVAAWRGVPGVVVLLNLFDPMKKSTASVAHLATCRMVRHYLRLSSSQLVGVCLYGVENSNASPLGAKNVIDVIQLAPLTLDDYKNLRAIDVTSYETPKEFNMSEALWYCSKMFTNCKKRLLSRTVIILSSLDIAPTEADQKPTLKRVRDLVDLNIDITIVNIAEDNYIPDEFYSNFLKEACKGKDVDIPPPVWDAQEIEKMIHQQSHRHLAVAQLKFEIGQGLSIGVGVYNLISKTQFKRVNLDRETNAVVSNVTKTVKVTNATNNGEEQPMDIDQAEEERNGTREMPLLKSELLHYQEFGGERVEFTDAEMKQLKNPFGPPTIKLLGFKPHTVMHKEKWFLKPGYFLFPNESIIEGSTVAFKAMHQACVETKMVAICILGTRVNAKPTMVALAPCTNPLGLDVDIGFDIINIPFVENVRDLPPVEEGEASVTNQQKGFLKDMLQQLKFDYKADMFQNPKLQCEYRAVEAIALEEDDIDPFVDTTKPSTERFEGIHADVFEQLFHTFEVAAPKRSNQSEFGRNSKRAKTEELDDTVLKHRVDTATVGKYTVDQLKTVLKNINDPDIPALNGLKKAQLVDLVYKHYK